METSGSELTSASEYGQCRSRTDICSASACCYSVHPSVRRIEWLVVLLAANDSKNTELRLDVTIRQQVVRVVHRRTQDCTMEGVLRGGSGIIQKRGRARGSEGQSPQNLKQECEISVQVLTFCRCHRITESGYTHPHLHDLLTWPARLRHTAIYEWRRGSVFRTSVFGWRTYPDLLLICG